MVDHSDLRKRFEDAKQSHVFDNYDSLGDEEKLSFDAQLSTIPVENLEGFLTAAKAIVANDSKSITPFSGPVVSIAEGKEQNENNDVNTWRQVGLQAIKEGKVAALVLAGGQGTRLGFDGPKGCYDIGMPSKKTLFQLLSERILRLQKLASDLSDDGEAAQSIKKLCLYIMTSPLNHEETVSFFQSHNNFGIEVYFFPQGMLPCLSESDGKILLEGPGRVAMAPDGNGGIYPALESSGMLAQMETSGVEYLHVFSIDNALCRPADPVFCGYCINVQADCGNKVLWKASAHEKVGVLAEQNGKSCIVEYSDITTDMAELTDDNGKLVFGAANICNHFYTLKFLKEQVLPNMANMYHVARKKIPFYDGSSTVHPTTPNGIKLESFIFDVFPFSKTMAVMNVSRASEFAPVKNASGNDSPESARIMLSTLAKEMVSEAGAKLKNVDGDKDENESNFICEVSPLTSYAGEGLSSEYNGKEIICPFSI